MEDYEHNPEGYITYFQAVTENVPFFRDQLVNSVGYSAYAHFMTLHRFMTEQYNFIQMLDAKADRGEPLTDFEEHERFDGRKLDDMYGGLYVAISAYLNRGMVDGVPLTAEEMEVLRAQLAASESTYQFLSFRYFAPEYFRDAIRSIRLGVSPKEAANYLLLGGKFLGGNKQRR